MKLFDVINNGDVYFIAEMSGNHGGSLDQALEIVHAAAKAGANCLKIQTFTPDTITLNSNKEDFQTRKGLWEGRTLYDLYSEAYTPWDWQARIKQECEKLEMDFLSSVFDNSSVDFLESLGVEAYKIASPELTDLPLIKYVASKMKPMVISCGMGDESEIRAAVETCRSVGNNDIVLLKCTSEYPAVYEDMNIATIADMKKRFACPVGLSDHSMGYAVDVAAVAIGASVIEKHLCLDRTVATVDSAFSMEPQEVSDMVVAVSQARKAIGEPTYERTKREATSLFGRQSIYASKTIKKGELFTEENVKIVRPAMGLAPKYWELLLGKKAPRDIEFADRIVTSDLGEGEISLRAVAPGDKERTFAWVTQTWYLNEFAGRKKPTWESHAEFFDNVASDDTQRYFAVICDGAHIGNAGLKYINEENPECWYYIGEESFRGRGLSKKIVKQLVEYACENLHLEKLQAKILDWNIASIKAVEANGFVKIEGDFGSFKGAPYLVLEKSL